MKDCFGPLDQFKPEPSIETGDLKHGYRSIWFSNILYIYLQSMVKIIEIITLFIISFFMISSSCDKGTEGCTDSNACNYDKNAAIDDNSCWFVSIGCHCEDPPNSILRVAPDSWV